MSEHFATVRWQHVSGNFLEREYSRDHLIEFPNGLQMQASAAAGYGGNPELIDPEAAFTAALSSCHMLTFLALCAVKGYVVKDYEDKAVGFLEKNPEGKLAMTRVKLRPRVKFEVEEPDIEQLHMLHDRAHRACFISNSVKTSVEIEPLLDSNHVTSDASKSAQ